MKDIVEFYPEAYEILARFGIKCLACDGMLNNTLEECADFHKLDLEKLIKELKQLELPKTDKS
jgi:hybrid cluster-associated redox disulfide protein